jgi:hypothetical protein
MNLPNDVISVDVKVEQIRVIAFCFAIDEADETSVMEDKLVKVLTVIRRRSVQSVCAYRM